MYRLDFAAWALASMGITAIEPDPSMVGFVRNASVVGSIIAAGWLVEARIGKKIGGSIAQHTAVEDERLKVVKAEVAGKFATLETKIDSIHEKLDGRPCAVRHVCKHT